MKMCLNCPRRDSANVQRSIAELHRSLGNEALALKCESFAAEIELTGCNWFWGMEYEHVIQGKPSGLKETRSECGILHVGAMIRDQGSRVEEACQSIQSNRNEIANIKDGLVKTLETGFGQLAAVVSTQLEADRLPHVHSGYPLGYPPVYSALAACGTLGGLREELAGAPGAGPDQDEREDQAVQEALPQEASQEVSGDDQRMQGD